MNLTPHLTDEAFYTLLDDSASPDRFAAEQHLAACALCRTEFTSLRSSLTSFRLAATHLAHVQTPDMAPDRTRLLHRSSRPFVTMPRAAWATGLVAAMALCTASVSLLHKPGSAAAPTTQTAAASATSTRPAQTDDALLNDIEQDLSTSVPPSLSPLDTPAAAGAAEKTATSSND